MSTAAYWNRRACGISETECHGGFGVSLGPASCAVQAMSVAGRMFTRVLYGQALVRVFLPEWVFVQFVRVPAASKNANTSGGIASPFTPLSQYDLPSMSSDCTSFADG